MGWLWVGHHLAIRTDDLEVERWADPYGIGIDQVLDDKGTAVAIALRVNGWDSSLFQFRNEFAGLDFTSYLFRVVQPQKTPSPMAVFAVLANGNVGYTVSFMRGP